MIDLRFALISQASRLSHSLQQLGSCPPAKFRHFVLEGLSVPVTTATS